MAVYNKTFHKIWKYLKGSTLIIYNIVLHCFLIFAFPLFFLILIHKKRRQTVLQRLGIVGIKGKKQPLKTNNKNKPIWIHALSVGEVISVQPLISKLKEDKCKHNIIFSTSTKTGFEIANNLFNNEQHIQSVLYFPYDIPFSIKRISHKVDPVFVIIVESDIWPNFLNYMNKRKIPVFLVNARLSIKSFNGYKKVNFFSKKIFSLFSKICVQTEKDAFRFRELSVSLEKIAITGNLKFDQKLSIDKQIPLFTKKMFGIKKNSIVLIAGSTHEGEELIILKAFIKLKEKHPNTVLILAPRDPERAKQLKTIFIKKNFITTFITKLNIVTDINTDIIIVNTIGMLTKLYAVSDIAFIGGSMVSFGGHNPLEPAVFAKPILFGPDMSDFALIAKYLLEAKGAQTVLNYDELYNKVKKLIENNTLRKDMGKNAFNVFNNNKGAVNKTLEIIKNEQLKNE